MLICHGTQPLSLPPGEVAGGRGDVLTSDSKASLTVSGNHSVSVGLASGKVSDSRPGLTAGPEAPRASKRKWNQKWKLLAREK